MTSPDVAADVELAESVSIAMLTVLETLGSGRARRVRAPRGVRDLLRRDRRSGRQVAGRRPADRPPGPRARRGSAPPGAGQHDGAAGGRGSVPRRRPTTATCKASSTSSPPTSSWSPTAAAWSPRLAVRSRARNGWPRFLMGAAPHRRTSRRRPSGSTGRPAARIDIGGEVDTAVSITVEDGRITRIYAVRNPHKLARPRRGLRTHANLTACRSVWCSRRRRSARPSPTCAVRRRGSRSSASPTCSPTTTCSAPIPSAHAPWTGPVRRPHHVPRAVRAVRLPRRVHRARAGHRRHHPPAAPDRARRQAGGRGRPAHRGRFRLGVGIGWNAVEYEALGKEFGDRGRRMSEQIALLRRLWTEPVVTHDGTYDRITAAGLAPLPISARSRSGSAASPRRPTAASAAWPTAGSRRCRRGRSSTRPAPSSPRRRPRPGRDPATLGMEGRVQLDRRRRRQAGRPRRALARGRRDPPRRSTR